MGDLFITSYPAGLSIKTLNNVGRPGYEANLFDVVHALDFQVTVALIDLSPELSYTSVPRLSPLSFLQAKAKNTSHYAMLAGPSNIFLDNNFIAKVPIHNVHAAIHGAMREEYL